MPVRALALLGAVNFAASVLVAAARSTAQAAVVNYIALAMSFLALGISGYVLFRFRAIVDPQTEQIKLIVNTSETPADRES